jgi:hypothetical protein
LNLIKLPQIFNCFAPGFVFIAIFKYVALRYEKYELKHFIFSAVAGSYIMKTLFDTFIARYFFTDPNIYSLLLISFAGVLAYCVAVSSRSKAWEFICGKLGIYRTNNANIWNDLFKREAWVRIYLKDGENTYIGQIFMCEENQREPIIVLGGYQHVKINGKVLADYSDNDKEFIILNLKDFDRIQMIDM